MTDYYKLLGVLPNATTDEIKKSYRQLALKYHPDRNPGDKNSEDFFKKITEAYSILSSPEERESYNWKYKKSQQTANYQNQQAKPKQEPVITPQLILSAFEDVRKKISDVDKGRINQAALYNSLNDLLSTNTISFLLTCGDIKTNNQIINKVTICLKSLDYQYVEKLAPKLATLAGADNNTIQQIYTFTKHHKYRNIWIPRFKGLVVIAAISLFYVVLNYGSNSSNSTVSDNRPSDGDLNNTFVGGNQGSIPPPISSSNHVYESTPEQKLQQEKGKLRAEGWEEKDVNNGQLPSCYNFIPKKSKIDNYLEVQVGGGTDVAIKVMNLRTDKCVRYVFINSGSTYKIRNIPEGTYYLKIAYGKDWFSKVEKGKCVGKFLRNPMYEKGNDIMNFNLQNTSDGYRVPSFQLQLDVIATNTMNTFSSQNISENEFNQ
ncbi:J domain-containing protein [Solitalea lacus]|uniref:J domain-containing protein n=1 Tax=Solitalea lacus TaxID=2911172 RepID=UPI001EDB81C8|nr:J domain-containing protein [Solitalea lacus]UKJ07918.1 J domain-containing protein [Solitalea lacus]